jgi:hypothetical protein
METEKTKEATSKGKSEGESSPRAEASVSHTQDGARRSRRKSRSRNPSRGDDGGLFAPHDITDCIVNGTDGEAEDSVDLRVCYCFPISFNYACMPVTKLTCTVYIVYA